MRHWRNIDQSHKSSSDLIVFHRQPYSDDCSASTLVFVSTAFYHGQPVQPNRPMCTLCRHDHPASPGVPSLSRKQRGLEKAGRLQYRGVNSRRAEQMKVKIKNNHTKTASHHLLVFFTFLVHCLTVLTSSDMTMSTHLVQGSLIFPICLFTMVSKAMSGVKRPVLPGRETARHRARKKKTGMEERKAEGERRVG